MYAKIHKIVHTALYLFRMRQILSPLPQDIAIISPNGSLIAITIYRGLDLLRARSKRRSISTRLSWRTAAPRCASLRETSISNRSTRGTPTSVEIRGFPPRICLNVSPLLLACANGPRARKVLLLPGGYHRQAVDIKDPFYISAVAG